MEWHGMKSLARFLFNTRNKNLAGLFQLYLQLCSVTAMWSLDKIPWEHKRSHEEMIFTYEVVRTCSYWSVLRWSPATWCCCLKGHLKWSSRTFYWSFYFLEWHQEVTSWNGMIVLVLRNLLPFSFSRHIFYHVQPDPSVFCSRKVNSSMNLIYHHLLIVKLNFQAV